MLEPVSPQKILEKTSFEKKIISKKANSENGES